jgi:diadenosine tetraphosphate (Ap4A) HIT family hydrolase
MDNDCLFCRKYLFKIFESKHFFVIYDDFPLRQGHILIISIRHIQYLTLLTRVEFDDLYDVIQEMVKHLEDKFGANGYNLGINDGEVAGQTIPHLHIHIIPRYFGDVENPRGGIRKFLPNPLAEYPLRRIE